MTLRDRIQRLFVETLDRLKLEDVLRERIRCTDDRLWAGEFAYPLGDLRRVVVVAIGKAAATMWDALAPTLRVIVEGGRSVEGIVVAPGRPQAVDPAVTYLPGCHPSPGPGSLKAAEEILRLLEGCDEHCLVLFLLSGGASAMVERPLDPEMSLEDVAGFHDALVRSGLSIVEMNVLRKHFSMVKGGRLAIAAGDAQQCTLCISDVPEGSLHTIGSGPSLPDPSTAADCRALVELHTAELGFSPKVLTYFRRPDLEETAKEGDAAFRRARWMSLLSSDDLCRVAGELARQAGYTVVVDNTCDEWEYRDAAAYLVERVVELRAQHGRVCLLSAGEVSVKVGAEHGQGGRNQQFVLECARLIHERRHMLTVLSGGSDGIDGNSAAAGAVCDETTFGRAATMGLDPMRALQAFDCYPFFRALGDAIVMGPTGNNVRDLRILLAD